MSVALCKSQGPSAIGQTGEVLPVTSYHTRFPGLAALRELQRRTRIPCACGRVSSRVYHFRPVCLACLKEMKLTPVETKDYLNAKAQRRKARLEFLGLCRNCGRQAEAGRRHCAACLSGAARRFRRRPLTPTARQHRAERAKVMRQRRKSAGLCIHCGHRADRLPLLHCRRCSERDKARLAVRKHTSPDLTYYENNSFYGDLSVVRA